MESRVSTLAALPPNAAMRWSIVRKILDRLSPQSVLEIGCGQGAFGTRIAPKVQRYLAVEPDPTSYAVARPRIEAVGGEIRNVMSDGIAEDDTFDLVCAFEVLEHLEDDKGATSEWFRHVRPGGHLMISMPAFQERYNNWDTMVGHYRRYSPAQVAEVLGQAGFEDVQTTVYGWPLGYALEAVRHRIAGRPGAVDSDGAVDPDGAVDSDGAVDPAGAPSSMEERTAKSGRLLQPKKAVGALVRVGVTPFIALQQARPSAGTGLVAIARRTG